MSVSNPVIDQVDTSAKLIYLAAGVTEYHPVTDIYMEIRNLRRTDETLRKFPPQVTAAGNVPKGGGKFTPRYAIFNNGYKVVPQDTTHALYISGEQITDTGQSGPDCVETSVLSAGTNVTIHYEPPAAEIVRADEELAAIWQTVYGGKVTIDQIDGAAGTDPPRGTHQYPVNNLTDALTIAERWGLYILHVHGTLSVGTGYNVSRKWFEGTGANTSQLIMEAPSVSQDCQFREIYLTGVLDGNAIVRQCSIQNLDYVSGFIHQCALAGKVTIAPASLAAIMSCYAGSTTDPLEIDCNGSGMISLRSYDGDVLLTNITSGQEVDVSLISGLVTIAASCTNGIVHLSGTGYYTNNGGPGITVKTIGLLNTERVGDMASDALDTKITDPVTGKVLIKNEAGDTVMEAPIYEDSSGIVPYRGQGIERRGPYTKP